MTVGWIIIKEHDSISELADAHTASRFLIVDRCRPEEKVKCCAREELCIFSPKPVAGDKVLSEKDSEIRRHHIAQSEIEMI